MKKSFMTRVLAVSLSAAMAFSVSSAGNLMTASAASTVNLKTTFKTLKVNQKYQLKLTNNTLGWKITKVTTSNKKICTVYDKKASSVMLKGKGVGRAKIKVKVKTTKRKYPKNIKYMTCTANVKAADTKPPVADTFSATVTPISVTQVRVNFNKAVDDATDAANFTVSDGVTVTKSEPDASKTSTVLTMEGAKAGKAYNLTVKNMKVGGEIQKDLNLSFTIPTDQQVVTGYKINITSDPQIVKSDGQHQARVTFEVLDDSGKPVNDNKAQIEFSASVGTFANTRATLVDGKAIVQYNAPQSNVGVSVPITASVVEATDPKMVGTVGSGSITLSPNPEELVSEAAIITSAAAGTADRVIAYFDKDVKASDFMKDGRPDTSKFACTIKSGIDSWNSNAGNARPHQVVAILDVPGANNALEILVDNPMRDNSNVSVEFTDKRSSKNTVSATNTVYFRLADAREPSALTIESTGTKKIVVNFSEAVLKTLEDAPVTRYAANNIDNWLIDGKPLSSFGVDQAESYGLSELPGDSGDDFARTRKDARKNQDRYNANDGHVRVGNYNVETKTKEGKDERSKVTITLGSNSQLTAGDHILTVRNVGDWAAQDDGARNSVSTETFTFNVKEDTSRPTFTVDVQSPEQFELNFVSPFKVLEDADTFTTPDSATDASVIRLQEYINGDWVDISGSGAQTTGNGRNPIRVSKILDGTDKNYMVEVERDWSEVYDYLGTKQSYWNKRLRLHVDANKLVNTTNNLRNEAINIELTDGEGVTNGSIMKQVDTTSPTIVSVDQATATNGTTLDSWNVEFTEPLKISQGANPEGLTPSQTQQAGVSGATQENQGVPVPYAQFINVADPTNVIDGEIETRYFVDAQDKKINVRPERTLTGGEWRLVVGSISDDFGTAIATDSKVITIDAQTVATDFKIVWAAVASNDNFANAYIGNIPGGNQGRYVYVKFSKPVDRATALDQSNYALNNQALPHGANIQADINGYDDHDGKLDSVTIVLPGGSNLTGNYTVDSQNSVLSVTGVVSADGEALSNGGMNTLPYNFGRSGSTYTNVANNSEIESRSAQYDAVWGNHVSEQYTGRSNEGFATVKDYYKALNDALKDDKYRKIELTAGQNIDLTSTDGASVFGRGETLAIKRAVDLDLNGNQIIGNVEVNAADTVHSMTISSSTPLVPRFTVAAPFT